jgi:hypothetical protein
MHFEVERSIRARPETLWAIITNRDTLLKGGFGIFRMEGSIAPGNKIKLWSEVSPKRAFPLKVAAWEPNKHMIWEGGMPLGLFKGVRRFDITTKDGGSHFRMREDYIGPLAGMITKSIPNLTPSFNTFADALKRAAEGA